MTRQEYLDNLLKSYLPICRFSEKNGCQVLRVRHEALGKDLVVHSLPQPVMAYEMLCGIRAENLPEIYDVIQTEDGMIVLEEFIDGMSVAEIMEVGRYRYRDARKVLLAVCDGLMVLHARGFVHRDIKPENIMVDKNGRVVLIDFNASRRLSESRRDTVIMGTVGYASPEQLGISQSDARTDIYAVGILLNVMLTGMHPSEQMARGRVGRIVRRCTQVNPNDRYQTAEKLSYAL